MNKYDEPTRMNVNGTKTEDVRLDEGDEYLTMQV